MVALLRGWPNLARKLATWPLAMEFAGLWHMRTDDGICLDGVGRTLGQNQLARLWQGEVPAKVAISRVAPKLLDQVALGAHPQPHFGRSWPTWARPSAEFSHMMPELDLFAEFGQVWTNLGQDLINVDQRWSKTVHVFPELDQLGRTWSNSGQIVG